MRSWLQLQKGRYPKQAHVGLDGLKDDELGRQGFVGKVAELYRRNDPTAWTRIDGPLRLWDINANKVVPGDQNDPRGRPTLMFFNSEVKISVSRRSAPMPYCCRNGDGDELHFIHRGTGVFETEFGPVEFGTGDYVLIPKGVTYRFVPATADNFTVILETTAELDFPDFGALGRHAPFDPTIIRIPEPKVYPSEGQKEWEVRIKQRDAYTSVFYPFHPFDVEGWKGDLFPFAMNIHDFRTVMSDRLHLPPTMHCNFQAKGVYVINFLPRPLEGDPSVERLPWYHRNADYDEIVFQHGGDFMGAPIAKGRMQFSPQGLHHGISEAVREMTRKMWKKDQRVNWELVAYDCEKPLQITPEAAEFQKKGM